MTRGPERQREQIPKTSFQSAGLIADSRTRDADLVLFTSSPKQLKRLLEMNIRSG